MVGLSPTQRTLFLLKGEGYKPWVVERFIQSKPFGKRIDLFHIIDIIALTPNGVMGVQSCGQAFSEHMRTLTETHKEESRAWLETPGTSLFLYGWRKLKVKNLDGKYGKRAGWAPRIQEITLEELT